MMRARMTNAAPVAATDHRLYRWSATELELMEIVVGQNTPDEGIEVLSTRNGMEDLVACVLQPEACAEESTWEGRPLAA